MRESSVTDEWSSRSGRRGGPSTQRRATEWQFGHGRKARRITSEFSKYSSLHGVHYICSDDAGASWLKRIFYSLLFGGCLLAMVASIYFLLQESLGAESVFISSTMKDGADGLEQDPFYPSHPRITLCRRPGYRLPSNSSERELLEYAFLSLGYPFAPLTPEERTLLVEIVVHQVRGLAPREELSAVAGRMELLKTRYDRMKGDGKDFNLTRFLLDNSVSCDRIFVRCVLEVFNMDCCEVFHPVLTPMGQCYSFVAGELADRGHDERFTFTFDLRAAPAIDRAVDVGYEIHITDPRNKEVMFHRAGYSIMNGYGTLLKTRLIKTSRMALFTAWHGLSSRCPTIPPELDPMGYGDRFFKSACEKRYMDKMMRDKCHCRLVTDSSNLTQRQCDPEDVYGCFFRVVFYDNLTEMSEKCVYACVEYEYESDASFVKIGRENISRLVFVYEGQQYSYYEYRMTTISGLLSQIGGAMGLYLGASIITAVELLTFLVFWIWYKLAPRRRPIYTSDKSALTRPRNKELYLS